jgi:hypothetical protein
MRNLVYLNGDGMVNVHPQVDTVQINDEYYCEMNDLQLAQYLARVGCDINSLGEIVDAEDSYRYGVVLCLK